MFLIGARGRFFRADLAAFGKIDKGIVHQLHALFFSGLNNSRQHKSFGFANDVRDRGRVGKCLQRKHATLAIRAGDQLLTDDAAQRFTHHDPNLFLLIDRKHIEHAIERAGSVPGMQRSQDQMPGLGRGDGERDRFQIAHLADHDHVRIFAERATQSGCERARVRVHFALRDVTTFRLQDVFNRIFQRDDVFAPLQIHLLDKRGQGGGFAAPHRAGHQDQSILIARQ